MTLEQQKELLQRYFDGEVSETERAQVDARLASDAVARKELEGLQSMRGQLQKAATQWQSGLDSDALFARIDAQLGHERAPTERLRVIAGGGVRSITERKVVRWTAFAVAAALALGWLSWELLPGTKETIALSSEILKVDFGNSAGKVIPTEDEEGKPVIVVWIEDDEKIFLTFARSLAALSFVAACATASQSSAQGRAKSAEVLIVLAKEEAGEIDSQLSAYQALRKPPFSSFGSMKVLGRPKLRLEQGKDSVVSLPNGRKMKVRWDDTSPDGRYRISTSISRERADYLPLLTVLALPNDPFFVAGQSFQGGTLVIGVRLLEP